MTKLRDGGYYVTIAGGLGTVRAGRHQNSFINSATNLDNVKVGSLDRPRASFLDHFSERRVSAQLLDALAELGSAGKLRMPALDVFTLPEAAAAFAHMDVPNRLGKTVISVANGTRV